MYGEFTAGCSFMRLFIAIEIPDDLKKIFGSLRADIPGARWVAAEQIHLTLAFLGEVEEAAVESLNSEIAGIQLHEFKLCFSGTGCFPNRHRPRVLWIGLEPEPRLDDLASRVRAAVLACGIPQEGRPFSPHVTLARFKLSPSRELDEFIDRNNKLKLQMFTVHEFILYQSQLTSQGAVHSPIRNFPLAAPGIGGEP